MMFGVQCGNLSHTAARNFPNWGFFFGGTNWGGRAGVGVGVDFMPSPVFGFRL